MSSVHESILDDLLNDSKFTWDLPDSIHIYININGIHAIYSSIQGLSIFSSSTKVY